MPPSTVPDIRNAPWMIVFIMYISQENIYEYLIEIYWVSFLTELTETITSKTAFALASKSVELTNFLLWIYSTLISLLFEKF